MNWWLASVVFGLILVIWFIEEMRRAPKEREYQDDFDDARLDTIRDELEEQTAPSRPHVRGLS